MASQHTKHTAQMEIMCVSSSATKPTHCQVEAQILRMGREDAATEEGTHNQLILRV